MRAVYLLLAVLLVARPAAATLVAAVSFRDGFVVASDRRTTNSDGSFVDATDKIFADGSALVVVTHRNDFSANRLTSELSQNKKIAKEDRSLIPRRGRQTIRRATARLPKALKIP